jgi:hypothetical protein
VARQREISVRTALGAGRPRLVRQLLTESLLLAGLGGIAGLAFASWGTQALLRALIATSPAQLPAWIRVETDAAVFAFAAGISLLVGLLFGLAPLVPALRIDLISTLKEGSRGTDGGGSRQVRHLLVVSEVALALLLLLGAGLTMKSLVRLWNVQPGFQSDGVLTVTARGRAGPGGRTALDPGEPRLCRAPVAGPGPARPARRDRWRSRPPQGVDRGRRGRPQRGRRM